MLDKYTAAIIAVISLVIIGLWAGSEDLTATEQLENCLSQSDLACVIELAYKHPSSTDPNIYRKKAARSLAYLGEPEKAFRFYTDFKTSEIGTVSKLIGIFNSLISNQPRIPESFAELHSNSNRVQIVSAILVYLTVKNRTYEIDKYLREIVDANEKLAVLNHAWAKLSRPVAFMHPEYGERLREVVDIQLDKLSKREATLSGLQAPDMLSVSHQTQLLALANKIGDPDERKRFIDGVARYNQQATTEAELFHLIEKLVRQRDNEHALEEIETITKKGKPKFHNQRFAAFIYSREFYRFWQRADPDYQDLLTEMLIERTHSWKDPVCKTDVYTGLALFYAYANRKDAALALLNRFEKAEPNTYNNLGGESMCPALGYFSTKLFQFILGSNSLVEIEENIARFAEKSREERVDLIGNLRGQSYYIMARAFGFSSSQSRDTIAKFQQKFELAVLPNISRNGAEVNYLSWATKSGDWENAVALIADMFDKLDKNSGSGDLWAEKIRDQFLRKLISDDQIEDGFFWREHRAQQSRSEL